MDTFLIWVPESPCLDPEPPPLSPLSFPFDSDLISLTFMYVLILEVRILDSLVLKALEAYTIVQSVCLALTVDWL